MSEHSFTTMCKMYNTLMEYVNKQGKKKPKNAVSHFFTTICARCIIHSWSMLTLRGGKKKQLVQHLFKTMCKMYYMFTVIIPASSLQFFLIFNFFSCFVTLAMKIKISWNSCSCGWEKKCQVSLHYLSNMYLHTMKCNRPGYLQHV
jgi:hypothetical protein